MIKNSEHAYIEWKSKLELVMKEQYNITKQCDYAFGWFHIFCIRGCSHITSAKIGGSWTPPSSLRQHLAYPPSSAMVRI